MAKETLEIICKVEKPAHQYEAYDIATNIEYTKDITVQRKREAFLNKKLLIKTVSSAGKVYWKMIDPEDDQIKTSLKTNKNMSLADLKLLYEGIFEEDETEKIRAYIKNSNSLKPRDLIIDDLDWKYLIRSGIRGENIMITGFQGCGKTKCAHALKVALRRPFEYFNLGATQDPRSALIGTTHSKDGSTTFVESRFAKAIQIPFSVILLDEVSRAHPEAWNILISVIDQTLRFLSLDESEDGKIIRVAEGVTFISTANIGGQFTSTRVMDVAFTDRWITMEMPLLTKEQEEELLMLEFPNLNPKVIEAIAETADFTRKEIVKDDAAFSDIITTRMSQAWAGLVKDGFSFRQAARVAIYPKFGKDGGIESERTKIKQTIQKWNDMVDIGLELHDDNDDSELFDLKVEDDL